jgi:hypothetical protein
MHFVERKTTTKCERVPLSQRAVKIRNCFQNSKDTIRFVARWNKEGCIPPSAYFRSSFSTKGLELTLFGLPKSLTDVDFFLGGRDHCLLVFLHSCHVCIYCSLQISSSPQRIQSRNQNDGRGTSLRHPWLKNLALRLLVYCLL